MSLSRSSELPLIYCNAASSLYLDPFESFLGLHSNLPQNFMSSRDACVSFTLHHTSEGDQVMQDQSRWHAAIFAMRAATNENAGLLLVIASQVFVAVMDFLPVVKILNTIDPPVSALQVGSSLPTYSCASINLNVF
jgi:hypothetical protein